MGANEPNGQREAFQVITFQAREDARWTPTFRMLLVVLSLASAFALTCNHAQSKEIPVSSPKASPIEPARQTFEEEDWARERASVLQHRVTDTQSLKEVQVLFLGDSITEFWESHGANQWEGAFGSSGIYKSMNLGFAGDRTENLLFHLLDKDSGGEAFLQNSELDPDVIVLMIGVNNTWRTDGPIVEDVVAGNIAIIARLRQLRPRSTIVVQSLLPAENSERSTNLIMPINQQLAKLVGGLGPKVIWLDLYRHFAEPDGTPEPSLFVDTVHPSAAGYEVWKPVLLDALKDLVGCPTQSSERSDGTR